MKIVEQDLSTGSDQDDLGLSLNEGDVEEINVVVRMRPLNARELDPLFTKQSIGQVAWNVMPDFETILMTIPEGGGSRPLSRGPQARNRDRDRDRSSSKHIISKSFKNKGKTSTTTRTAFKFDKIFDEDSTTRDVYDYAGKDLISGVVDGRNASIFAYGQTSSGKTHTMQGSRTIRAGAERTSKRGVVHFAAHDLFEEINTRIERDNDRDYSIHVSVVEVYNEELRDLLSRKSNNKLVIREDPDRGVFVNAVRYKTPTLEKLLGALSHGEKNRVVAKTTLNKRSSRSHIIFSIAVESVPKNKRERVQYSNLNLIDLAGSESVRHRSNHSNEMRRKEGGSINKSLLTLSLVIQALGAPSRNAHVSYRDSKLTRFLQPSLSGNSRLAFICCATKSGLYVEETKSTFQFASRIKHVKTKTTINVVEEDDTELLKRVKGELNEVKEMVNAMTQKLKQLEEENKDLKNLVGVLTHDKDRAVKRVKVLEAIQAQEEAMKQKQKREEEEHRASRQNGNGVTNRDLPVIMRINGNGNQKKEEAGFLSNVVEKIGYRQRRPLPPVMSDHGSTINGMPANIRPHSPGGISEITEPSRYGSHRSLMGSIGE